MDCKKGFYKLGGYLFLSLFTAHTALAQSVHDNFKNMADQCYQSFFDDARAEERDYAEHALEIVAVIKSTGILLEQARILFEHVETDEQIEAAAFGEFERSAFEFLDATFCFPNYFETLITDIKGLKSILEKERIRNRRSRRGFGFEDYMRGIPSIGNAYIKLATSAMLLYSIDADIPREASFAQQYIIEDAKFYLQRKDYHYR